MPVHPHLSSFVNDWHYCNFFGSVSRIHHFLSLGNQRDLAGYEITFHPLEEECVFAQVPEGYWKWIHGEFSQLNQGKMEEEDEK